MVLFGFVLFVSVAALLAAQAMDIECERPRRVKTYKLPAGRTDGFPAEPMGLRGV